jgi:LPXTG-site transpeptidase (sortase) family protein
MPGDHPNRKPLPSGRIWPGLVDAIAALTLPAAVQQPQDRRHGQRAQPRTVDDLTLPARACHRRATVPVAQRWAWTGGHLLVLLGGLVLLVLGGVWVDAQAQIAAAQGDGPPALAVRTAQAAPPPAPPVTPTAAPPLPAPSRPPVTIPVLNSGGSAAEPPADAATSGAAPSTITRLVIPAIGVDRQVVAVGWTTEDIDGQAVAVWDVDRSRVGHHQGSRNPGGGGTIVLSGHSGGKAYPFNELFYLKPGDQIDVWSVGQLHQYTVAEQHLVDEVGQPLDTRLENARFIAPTDEEVVTLVACWPLTGPTKFTQRVIIRATPIHGMLIEQDLSPIHPR